MLATAVSQGTFVVLLWLGMITPLAAAAGFLGGAIPNFFLARTWAWGRKGKPQVKHELLPYVAVIGIAGCVSVGLTTLTSWLTEPLALTGVVRIIVLDVAFLTSYALVFVMKFALLDRFVFAGGGGSRIRVARSRS